MTPQERIQADIAAATAQPESYVTKINPTIEDWIAYNQPLFDAHRNDELIGESHSYAPLTDFDLHANRLGVTREELFKQLQETVGPLGSMALRQVHSGMDDAWHVIIGPAPLPNAAE